MHPIQKEFFPWFYGSFSGCICLVITFNAYEVSWDTMDCIGRDPI